MMDYTDDIKDVYDIAHFISYQDEALIDRVLAQKIPVVFSALYCENDMKCALTTYAKVGKETKLVIKKEALRVLNKVNVVLTPNENELGVVVDKELVTQEDYIQASKELINKGVKNVVTTLGDKGCLFVSKDECMMIPSFKVKAIDTLGAGDSFTGSMSAMLDQGYSLKEALKIANAVGALECIRIIRNRPKTRRDAII